MTENMVYGTGQEEGKQNVGSICGDMESGAHEMLVKEHVYDLDTPTMFLISSHIQHRDPAKKW